MTASKAQDDQQVILEDLANMKLEEGESTSATDSSSGSSSESESDGSATRRNIKFESVKVREYNVTIGDHPNCYSGAPVQLDWDYDELSACDIEEYENERGPRRSHTQMFMNKRYRNQVLQEAGHTEDELIKAEKDVQKIQRQRELTKMMLPFSKVEEVCASAKRKTKRLSTPKK
jgi:hypothetical protein